MQIFIVIFSCYLVLFAAIFVKFCNVRVKMSRKILHSRAREIVIKVDDYIEKEKEESKVILQNITRSLKNASDTSDDVVQQTKFQFLFCNGN